MTEQTTQKKEKTKRVNRTREKKKNSEAIENKIIRIMYGHVGIDKSISPYDLFSKVYNIEADILNEHQAFYYWIRLKRAMHALRKSNRCFIIIRGQKVFILKSWEEYAYFKKRTNNTIKALHEIKGKANEWVRKEKFKEFEK